MDKDQLHADGTFNVSPRFGDAEVGARDLARVRRARRQWSSEDDRLLRDEDELRMELPR